MTNERKEVYEGTRRLKEAHFLLKAVEVSVDRAHCFIKALRETVEELELAVAVKTHALKEANKRVAELEAEAQAQKKHKIGEELEYWQVEAQKYVDLYREAISQGANND